MTKTSLVNRNVTASFTRRSFIEMEPELFPDIPCPMTPFGARVMVQVATPVSKTDGGIHLTQDYIELQKWTQNLAKVIAFGPVAYRDRNTLDLWPEGFWCKIGDYVHAPLYGGHRTEVRDDRGRVALFAMVQDRELYNGIKEGFDPMSMKPWQQTE